MWFQKEHILKKNKLDLLFLFLEPIVHILVSSLVEFMKIIEMYEIPSTYMPYS